MYKGLGAALVALMLFPVFPVLAIIGVVGAIAIYLVCAHNNEVNYPKASKMIDAPPLSANDWAVQRTRQKRRVLVDEWIQYLKKEGIEVTYWNWYTANNVEKIAFEDDTGVSYIGIFKFADSDHPDCHDQPRVLSVDSVIEGTNVHRQWPGTPMKRVPIDSIRKNIANSFKNDMSVRKALENAHAQCLMQGYGLIELRDISLDFTDPRVKKEFLRKCLTSGNFKSAHLQTNGHEIKVFAGNSDPLPY